MKILKSPWSKLGVIVLFVIAALLTLISLYRIATTTAPDYSVLWNAAKDLPTSKNPYLNRELYTGVGYPPNTLLFYLPLSVLPYQISQALFLLLSVISLIACIHLSFKVCFKRFDRWLFLLVTSLVFLAFPTKFTLGMGQNNSVSFLLLLLSLYFYKGKKDVPSGIFFGLSVAYKTVFGFFLLFFLFKSKWKLIFSFLGTLVLSVAMTNLVSTSPTNLYLYYVQNVIPPLLNYQGREIYFNQGIVGFISRIFGDASLRKVLSEGLSLFLTIFLVVFNLIKKGKDLLVFSSFVISLLLIDSLSWQHHFVWLILPFVVLISETKRRQKHRFILFLLIFVSYILIGWNFKNPWILNGFPEVLLLSTQFYGAVILLLINFYYLMIGNNTRE